MFFSFFYKNSLGQPKIIETPPLSHCLPCTKHTGNTLSFGSITSVKMMTKVKKSTMVQPAQDTPQGGLWIANIDLMTPRIIPALTIYFYRPNGSSNFFDARVLKEALGKVLVPFYPMAGRLGRDKDGRIEINCNGEGALFVEAETTSVMEDLGDFAPSMELKPLIPDVDISEAISSIPLLFLQVTRFQCGGVSLGVGVNHNVADRLSTFDFINAWSQMARGLSISVQPLVDRTNLRARDPPTPRFNHIEYKPLPSLKTPQQRKKCHAVVVTDVDTDADLDPDTTNITSVAMFKINYDQINILKDKCKEGDKPSKYTSYEILAAHVWRCSCKAQGLPDDQETNMQTPVNGRSRLHPPIPRAFFGNGLFFSTAVALSGDLINNPLTYAAGRIHAALTKMDDEYLRSALDYLELRPDLTALAKGVHRLRSPNMAVTSWKQLPTHDADFGWGRPIFVGPGGGMSYEGIGFLLPSPTDGSYTLAITLQIEDMKAFEKILYEF